MTLTPGEGAASERYEPNWPTFSPPAGQSSPIGWGPNKAVPWVRAHMPVGPMWQPARLDHSAQKWLPSPSSVSRRDTRTEVYCRIVKVRSTSHYFTDQPKCSVGSKSRAAADEDTQTPVSGTEWNWCLQRLRAAPRWLESAHALKKPTVPAGRPSPSVHGRALTCQPRPPNEKLTCACAQEQKAPPRALSLSLGRKRSTRACSACAPRCAGWVCPMPYESPTRQRDGPLPR